MTLPERAVQPVRYISIDGRQPPQAVDGEVVSETLACISVNGEELATFMCSPTGLEDLAIGFLYTEGLITTLQDIETLHLSKNDCVDLWVKHFVKPRRKIKTSGCGGGVTFQELTQEYAPLDSARTAAPEVLAEQMRAMQLGAGLYQRARGIHTAALADDTGLLIQVEDLGRHNCIDKIAGAALRLGIDTRDKTLLSSGRISSEMLTKARKLGIPLVCSRTSPTSLSVALADSWQITIVAYLRQSRMRIYTHPHRIVLPDST